MNSTKERPMAVNRPVSRRKLLGAAAASLVAGGVMGVDSVTAMQEATPAQRDPLVVGMAPSTVEASDTFQQARGHRIVLNTQEQSASKVQNRFDTAVLEMFNVMHANEFCLANGEYAGFIAQGNIPAGGDLEEFGQQLTDVPGEFLITTAYYPKGAIASLENDQSEWGVFDARKGLRLEFTEEPGLFDVSLGMTSQIFGLTPRIDSDGGLKAQIFLLNQPVPSSYPNPENAEDIAHTWIASIMLQFMMLTYGSRAICDPVYSLGPVPAKVLVQYEMLFNPPYTINETISTLMSNKPAGSAYFNYTILNRSCLLDYQPV
jgi:hypothetical protein